MFIELANIFSPPRRLTVSQAAAENVVINNPGAYNGNWSADETPYMVEPADEMTSRDKTGLVFVGPAQTGKTQALILNQLAYAIAENPCDMAIFSPTAASAKDFSFRRVARMLRHSPTLGTKLIRGKQNDNIYEKKFTNGMYLALGWPTITQFAGRPIQWVLLTDYDRMDDDIEGEGPAYGLASKRTTTFGTFGMTLAESSPSRQIESNRWIASSLHEAPPVGGILSLYNQGDRRRLYWPCPHCGGWFEGQFEQLEWDTEIKNPLLAARTTILRCPLLNCNKAIRFNQRDDMLQLSKWVKDGQTIEDDQVVGEARESRIASFWLNGLAAKFISWSRLVNNFLVATESYEKTGDEGELKTFYNTDLGRPYQPKRIEHERLPEVLKSRAEKMKEREVPADVRFLLGLVDVQTNRFECMVVGVRPGQPFDLVVVDRFKIVASARTGPDEEGTQWVKPATYLEDWDLLVHRLLEKTYPLDDDSGRHMRIKAVGCDSGGKAGTTVNAYDFWRSLRPKGLASRFHLVKGDPSPGNPSVKIVFPDSSRKDRLAGARGDVPVLLINSNLMKDAFVGRLECVEPGKGRFLCPEWLDDDFFTELCAETRTDKGWENLQRSRNEAWDLGYYALSLCLSPYVNALQINWDNPPGWAAPWDKNDMVSKAGTERFANKPQIDYDFAALGSRLA